MVVFVCSCVICGCLDYRFEVFVLGFCICE